MRAREVASMISVLLLMSQPAAAANFSGSTQPAPAQEDQASTMSATISPVHLFLPVLEIALEYRFSENVSGGLIVGAGNVHQDGLTERTFVYELGFQGRFYAFDDFEGGHAGFEALYLGTSHSEEGVEVAGEGLAFGPLLGWKFVLKSGFVIDLQGGYQFVVVSAKGSDSNTGATASESQRDGIPLVNINLGFSF